MIFIKAWLLHHANRGVKALGRYEYTAKQQFYAIKNKWLQKHGKNLFSYNIQVIPGKICYRCGGSGIFDPDYHDEDDWTCDSCGGTGWYKRPKTTFLLKYRMGKYTFHQPLTGAEFSKYHHRVAYSQDNNIEGYIEHTPSLYSTDCLFFLLWWYHNNPKFWNNEQSHLLIVKWRIKIKKRFFKTKIKLEDNPDLPF